MTERASIPAVLPGGRCERTFWPWFTPDGPETYPIVSRLLGERMGAQRTPGWSWGPRRIYWRTQAGCALAGRTHRVTINSRAREMVLGPLERVDTPTLGDGDRVVEVSALTPAPLCRRSPSSSARTSRSTPSGDRGTSGTLSAVR